uniref:CSON010652 protein n=1 Tax=Culicoides sonorensis TaxID=179676 RepID=A0A336M2P2_CULSO
MSLLKSFSSYIFFTPPHIILLLLSSCVLTISNCSAIPLSSSSSSSSGSTNIFNRNSNLGHQLPIPQYRYNNNNNYYYGKSDDLISSSENNDLSHGTVDENNFINFLGKESYLHSPAAPSLSSELNDIHPLIPVYSNPKIGNNLNGDRLKNDEINEILNGFFGATRGNGFDDSDSYTNQMDQHSFEILRKQIEKNYPEGPLPIVYVEESKPITSSLPLTSSPMDKRSGRYYRRYPWKRQQKGKGSYDPDTRYMCTPSRDEIFRLLVGLHETHKGNERKLVNFCNRRRPAKTVFTNIRFLG